LRRTDNVSAGGTAEDVTSLVHPDNLLLAQRAVRLVGLDIAGVDFLSTDISRSWRDVGGAICEINAQPGLRPHWLADPQRDINGEIVDILFGGRPSRIPTAAITGTNGKSTTALMLHHIWMTAGAFAGVCTTQLVRIGDEIVECGEFSMHRRAQVVLTDPGVEVGIFELSAGELAQCGYPCDRYDVVAVLSGAGDYAGLVERTQDALVVNADDPVCVGMLSRTVTARHILVSGGQSNAPVAEHRSQGGEAVIIADCSGESWVVLAAGESEAMLMPVREIGVAAHEDAMFAAAIAWAQGIDIAVIRRALAAFGCPSGGPAEESR
jgi:cyanophycin synthetase